jgi:DNA-binding beta-propeller fold protein YncE
MRTALGLLALSWLCACSGDPLVACTSDDPSASVICGLQNPEDLARIPGTRSLLVSQFGSMDEDRPGALALLDTTTRKITPLFPQGGVGAEPQIHEGPDWGDASCEGPPDKRFNPHGIDLHTRPDGRHELFVVNHGGREAVEIFELLQNDGRHELQWRGCVPMPAGLFLNDVSALPHVGFVATHMFERGHGARALYQMARATFRFDTGYVVQWSPGNRVHKLPGTDAPFPNGIATSADGREMFVNVYMSNEVRRIERKTGRLLGRAPVAHPDNITWSDDGTLLVAAHVGGLSQVSACQRIQKGACTASFDIVSLDPRTMRTRQVLHRDGAPMGAGTVALPIEQELFIGSFKSDRMLVVPR